MNRVFIYEGVRDLLSQGLKLKDRHEIFKKNRFVSVFSEFILSITYCKNFTFYKETRNNDST